MICRSCRVHILSRLSLSARPFPSTAKASPQWRIPQSSRRTYATAAGDSASTAETAAENGPNGKTAAVVSSVQGGMRLDGINYLKNKTEVVAMNDEEYPDWLWSLLDEKKEAGAHGGVDPSSLTKKQRKRHDKKVAARMSTMPTQIPIHAQAGDIVSHGEADGVRENLEAAEKTIAARREITKSQRSARRKAIKEDNFLRSM